MIVNLTFLYFILSIISSTSTAFYSRYLKVTTKRTPVFSTRDSSLSLPEQSRKELWRSISSLEKQAVQKLSSAQLSEDDRNEAIKLLVQSITLKSSDPFIQLAQHYSEAVESGDQKEIDRVFSSLKQAGLPPHLQAIVKNIGRDNVSGVDEDIESPAEYEEVDPGSVFSDTVTEKIRVKIHAYYDSVKSEPANGKFMFWYKVAIFNEGTEPIQVVARMWEIEKCRGEKEVVRGAGIIGTQPIIPPGEVFTYKSACPLKVFPPRGKRVIGSMSGAYTLCKGNMGQHNFTVKVSKFNFILPEDVASSLP